MKIAHFLLKVGWKYTGARYKALFLPSHIPVVDMDYPGLRCRASSYPEFRLSKPVRNEPHTVRFIEEMKPREVLYDIGAAIGSYALIAGKRGLKVFAFEPFPASFAALLANRELNGLEQDITLFNVALGERTELSPFAYRSVDAGETLHGGLGGAGESAYRLSAWALDAARAQAGIPFPARIKIDVDGGELGVLKGARETLQHCSGLQVEVRTATEASVRVFLEQSGFVCAREIPRVKKGKREKVFDGVKDLQWQKLS